MESFNGRMRDELLNESLFFSLDHARQKLAAWMTTTTPRPRLDRLPNTRAYATHLSATCRPAANVEAPRLRLLLTPRWKA